MKSIAELRTMANQKNEAAAKEIISKTESNIEKTAKYGGYAVVLSVHDFGPAIFSPDVINHFSEQGFTVHRADTTIGIKW